MALIDYRSSMPKHLTKKWKTRTTADTIIVHTSASNNQDPKKTALYHLTPGPDNHLSKTGAPGLAYHDFIIKDGTIYHCNDYASVTWHCGLWNTRSIGVVMAFTGQSGEVPAEKQYEAMLKHVTTQCLILKILPERVMGHREVPGMITILGNGSRRYKKVCPGWGVDLDQMRDSITKRLQQKLSDKGLYKGPIDGAFGPNSKNALISFNPLKDTDYKIVNWNTNLK